MLVPTLTLVTPTIRFPKDGSLPNRFSVLGADLLVVIVVGIGRNEGMTRPSITISVITTVVIESTTVSMIVITIVPSLLLTFWAILYEMSWFTATVTVTIVGRIVIAARNESLSIRIWYHDTLVS